VWLPSITRRLNEQIRKLDRTALLRRQIITAFLSDKDYDKFVALSKWDDSAGKWVLPSIEMNVVLPKIGGTLSEGVGGGGGSGANNNDDDGPYQSGGGGGGGGMSGGGMGPVNGVPREWRAVSPATKQRRVRLCLLFLLVRLLGLFVCLFLASFISIL
jgi:hypothetical protein